MKGLKLETGDWVIRLFVRSIGFVIINDAYTHPYPKYITIHHLHTHRISFAIFFLFATPRRLDEGGRYYHIIFRKSFIDKDNIITFKIHSQIFDWFDTLRNYLISLRQKLINIFNCK